MSLVRFGSKNAVLFGFTTRVIAKGGATVLKVGGQFCERSEPKKNF